MFCETLNHIFAPSEIVRWTCIGLDRNGSTMSSVYIEKFGLVIFAGKLPLRLKPSPIIFTKNTPNCLETTMNCIPSFSRASARWLAYHLPIVVGGFHKVSPHLSLCVLKLLLILSVPFFSIRCGMRHFWFFDICFASSWFPPSYSSSRRSTIFCCVGMAFSSGSWLGLHW